MISDFTNIAYLKNGNPCQQQAYQELTSLAIFESLVAYNPILTGTIPLGIHIPGSDLDIICECKDHTVFADTLRSLYANKDQFNIETHDWKGVKTTIASFQSSRFPIEIFGQDCPTEEQNAFRHMLIEHEILRSKDDEFKAAVIRLKKEGLKTEPAFAKLLGIKGDPYQELLTYKR